MSKDVNEKRKEQVLERAKKLANKKVMSYLMDDFMDKIDAAGPHAGVWLEGLESSFDELAEKPDGLLKKFDEQDFEDLFQALYGYER